MPFGKIFTYEVRNFLPLDHPAPKMRRADSFPPAGKQNNPRTTGILAAAKANKVDLEVVQADTAKPSADHLKASPLGKVPAFLGEDGYALSECVAIAIYSTSVRRSLHSQFCQTPPL
jgi:hypothetical protein